MIDGVRFLSGLEFRRVIGIARSGLREKADGTGVKRKVTTETDVMFLAEMENEALATFETTQSAPGYGNLFRIEVSGERGTLSVNSERPNEIRRTAPECIGWRVLRKTDFHTQTVPKGFPNRNSPSSPGAIIDAIRGEPVMYPTFADGVSAQRILQALSSSIENNAWITLK